MVLFSQHRQFNTSWGIPHATVSDLFRDIAIVYSFDRVITSNPRVYLSPAYDLRYSHCKVSISIYQKVRKLQQERCHPNDTTHTGLPGAAGEPLQCGMMSDSSMHPRSIEDSNSEASSSRGKLKIQECSTTNVSEEHPNGDLSGLRTASYSGSLEQAIQLADNIARRYSSSTHWSTWHTWDLLRHGYDASSSPDAFWDAIYPFATCVGFCFLVAADLSATYKSTKGLTHFSEKIQTLASWEKDESEPNSVARPRHCVVAIFTKEACILIDLIYSPTVFVILMGGSCETVPYITISGRRGKRIFHYTGSQHGRKLEIENPKRDHPTRYQFWPIAHGEALSSISAYSATRTIPRSQLPMNKVIVIRGPVREPPTKVPGTQLDAGSWMIITCRLQIDFLHRRLTLQLPLEDWLLKSRK